jgi:two-component system, OmpR family, sensor kinase
VRRLGLSSLRNQLVLLIFGITAAAVGFVYLYVVPQLQSSLTAEKLRRLDRLGSEQGVVLERTLQGAAPQAELQRLVGRIAQTTESRVTLLALDPETQRPSFVIADSESEASAVLPRYPVAESATRSGQVASGVESVSGERVGQAAVPILLDGQPRWVAVLSGQLDEVDDNVALIRRQILIAGAIAMLAALVIGYWAARAGVARLKRLRYAAENVAEGDFTEPIPVESSDEIGQLARTFNEMQRRLARLDSARKEFIANASHELRTPIFSLGGFVELLEHENPSKAERQEFVERMRGQIERLQKLTTDLLDLSKLDADTLEINPENVDLKPLVRTIAGDFRPVARQRGSKLEVRSGRESAVARCDPDRVAQIIRILIDNALTHTPQGTKVTITALRERGSAQVIVGDDGRGIDRRSQQKVFERFYSGDAAAGSGLGLAIAAELADRMGGDLQLVSRRGFTAFTLTLPPDGRAAGRRRTAGATA